MRKKSKKTIRNNNRNIINYTMHHFLNQLYMYMHMTYCQYLIKVGRRKKEEDRKVL